MTILKAPASLLEACELAIAALEQTQREEIAPDGTLLRGAASKRRLARASKRARDAWKKTDRLSCLP